MVKVRFCHQVLITKFDWVFEIFFQFRSDFTIHIFGLSWNDPGMGKTLKIFKKKCWKYRKYNGGKTWTSLKTPKMLRLYMIFWEKTKISLLFSRELLSAETVFPSIFAEKTYSVSYLSVGICTACSGWCLYVYEQYIMHLISPHFVTNCAIVSTYKLCF